MQRNDQSDHCVMAVRAAARCGICCVAAVKLAVLAQTCGESVILQIESCDMAVHVSALLPSACVDARVATVIDAASRPCTRGSLVAAPPPPTPVVANIVPVVLSSTDEAETARAVASAFAAFTPQSDVPDTGGTPRRQPVATVKSSISFPGVQLDVIAEGTAARAELERGLKAGLAAQLGGGGVIEAESIVIESITALGSLAGRRQLQDNGRHAGSAETLGSRPRQLQTTGIDVQWHIEAPLTVMQAVANLVATIATSAREVSVVVAGSTVVASEIAAPVVYTEPDVDCDGAWLTCDEYCKRYFHIDVVASGTGADCRWGWYEEQDCSYGEGSCPSVETARGTPREFALEVVAGVGAASLCCVAIIIAIWGFACRRSETEVVECKIVQDATGHASGEELALPTFKVAEKRAAEHLPSFTSR